MTAKKQVVICTDGVFPHAVGGMQRHSSLLVKHLAKNPEWEIIVFHPHQEKIFSDLNNVIEEHISPIDQKKNYLRECYAYSKRVFTVLQKYPKAVIYSQGLSVWYKANSFSSRLIINPHGLEPYQAMGFKDKLIAIPFKRVFNRLFRKAYRVVSLGGNLTNILSRIVPREKIAILPNGVQPKKASPKNFDVKPWKMFFVARFAHNKGIHILMEAVKQLNAEGAGDLFEFHLVGKGPLFDHYNTQEKQHNIFLHGFVNDDELEKMYADFHAMVFPTLFEGMPTVILEAMAHGMPVIATDTGAVAELVDDHTGWLIQRGSVEALKKALYGFKDAPAHVKEKMSVQAINKVEEHFAWDKVAQRHLQLFEEVNSQITGLNKK